uniref:DBH-like monooxygenase protein 1 n=1 Tax=Ciona intestinalis TaxID=7719 RepID=UPI000180B9FC|nr:DBH-like monooxygenase protein 1 [Ciona intestinalis]XP_026690880.1 DBH-like monooxygenase protein 1 [Ciona intestinalis]|eukprot:XP_002124053.1 DBH-like monooxygenase protein 1 [Ciona intestinalis]
MLFDIPNFSESMFPEGEEETHHSFDLINEEFHLPAVKSYYNCRVMALPQTGEKLHLVKSEPIIQPGHELFLHHILLYECAGDYAVPPTEHVNSNDQCYTANMPPGSESCQKVILAWAIGGGAFYFPKHTGLVFGVEGAPRYVVMETHYDNPNAMAGVVDSSGLRITYTSRLRQFDTGILELGHTVSGIQHIIPPQAQSFLSYGTCTENCMSSSMDDAGVTELNIYGVMQHSHLLGTGMKTRYFRGGVELPPLSEDKSYDFNYQETRILQEERVFKKGDAMQVVCNYKSMDETELTYGGLDTTKEMCMSFIYYYPAMQLSFCQTAAEYNTLLNYFGISEVSFIGENQGIYSDLTNLAIVKPEELSNLTVADYINSLDWNQELAENFSVAANKMLLIQNCLGPNGVPSNSKFYLYPHKIDEPYIQPVENCSEPSVGTTVDEVFDGCQVDPATTLQPTTVQTKLPPVIDPEPTEPFPHNIVLDTDGLLKLYWNYNDTHITFEMHGQTTGWVGIGLSPNGGMIDADIYIGWVKEGTAYITDRHGQDSNTYPPKDPEQNVEFLAGYECDGWTVIKFVRQLPACEADYDRPITGDTIKMIWAFGANDPAGDDVVGPDDYHQTNRGTKSVILIDIPTGDDTLFPEGEAHHTLDLMVDNLHLPTVATYYNCHLFEIPTDKKYHLVMAEPILHPGNEQHLHHLTVYFCSGLGATEHLGVNKECYSANMPDDYATCSQVVVGWAIGGGPVIFPKHTGLVFGDGSSAKYVMLEIHYDNPTVKPDIIDSSGLRLTYTPDLRHYDSGTLLVAQLTSGRRHILPPHANSFLTTATCTSPCLTAGMNTTGTNKLNVFGIMLHGHLAAQGIELKHLRDNVELPPLAKDASYDFNYQETRMFSTEKNINAGDDLQVICNYQTRDKSKITLGGLTTTQEMCEAFIYYYPKITTSYCLTSPLMTSVLEYFGIEETDYGNYSSYETVYDERIVRPESLAGVVLGDYIDSLNWDEAKIKDFEQATHDMQHYQYCTKTDNGFYPIEDVPILQQEAQIDVPYEEPVQRCSDPRTGVTSGDALDICLVDTTTVIMETTTLEMAVETTTDSAASLESSILSIVALLIMIFAFQ